jgi:hypothetical protein
VTSRRAFLAYERSAMDESSHVLCVHNVTGRPQTFEASASDGVTVRGRLVDLTNGERTATVDPYGRVSFTLEPYGVAWMRQRR